MFLPLMAGLWKPVAIALLIAAVLGYRALLVHQRDSVRAEVTHLNASLADAEASGARALENARIDAGCAAAIRWGNAQAEELSRW
jgi:hypothetical protein